MKDIEITIRESHAPGEGVAIQENGLDPEHVAMALVRAVTAACTQLGADSPAQQFRAAEDGVARLREVREGPELAAINNTLTAHGFGGYQGAAGVSAILGHLVAQARVGAALSPEFAGVLAHARAAFRISSLAGRDLDAHDSAGIAKTAEPGQVAALVRGVQALGELLRTMRAIDPEQVLNDNGSTTITLTEPVPIGTPEGDVEVTGGRGEPC